MDVRRRRRRRRWTKGLLLLWTVLAAAAAAASGREIADRGAAFSGSEDFITDGEASPLARTSADAGGEGGGEDEEGSGDAVTLSDRLVADQGDDRPPGPSHAHADSEDFDQVRPVDIRVAAFAPRELALTWNLPLKDRSTIVTGYRIWYRNYGSNFTDVKTIQSDATLYKLTGLSPFTMYEIWVEGILNNTIRTEPSAKISAHTDVDQPGPPVIHNVTCHGTGSLFVEWSKPNEYFNSVDYYRIYYRNSDDSKFKSVVVQSNPSADMENVRSDQVS